jgi:hypothetical protein
MTGDVRDAEDLVHGIDRPPVTGPKPKTIKK